METSNQPSPSSSSSVPKIVGVVVAIVVCCACALILGAGGLIYQVYRQQSSNIPALMTPFIKTPTLQATPQLERPSTDAVSSTTLDTLEQTNVPENDPNELACRLQSVCNVPQTIQAKTYQVGDKEKFWISNSDTAEHRQGNFTLRYITPHSYFWAEDGTDVNENDMKQLMDTFESKIYPTDREFFGSEATPGVDNDPHIYVLYAHDIGSNVAGYYNSSDNYNPQVKEYSNAHDTYVLGSTQDLGDQYTYATLAHEFVHMIQNASDRNDVSWMNEGFAEVGAFLNKYDVGGADWFYMQQPDLQLNSWVESSSPDFGSHYGQSFLYLTYFLDRFGKEATQALTNNPENDLPSVDDTLAQLNITDPGTGKVITADDVFMDWAAALYLQDGNVGDGRYTYHNYPDAPQYKPTDTINNCPQSVSSQVNQYGIDYYDISCAGDHTLTFTGSTVTGLLPVDAHSGKYVYWSNRGDESDMTLTREFDLTNASGPVNMSFSMWHDVETDYDYVFLEASTDGGQTWKIVKTPSGTDKDPSGNSYGWGYNGQTNSWVDETVDLSEYAGQKVQLRFEYITDAALNGEGFMLDDVKLDAINYQTDFETDDGGWQAEGFARVENVLPQTYRLNLIVKGDNGTTVTPITVNADQTAQIPLSLKNGEQATLIVTGTTRFTRQPAAYQFEIK
jgi:immune inhibitor A